MLEKTKYILKVLLFFKFNLKELSHYLQLSSNERYAFFQKYFYDKNAKTSNYKLDVKKDILVGSYEQHNEWKDYDKYLITYAKKGYKDKIALDFGCGPGRNIVKYHNLFKRIDGVDISSELIKKGKENLKYHKIKIPNLYVNNGYDISEIPNNSYNFIMSTICLQHICVYSTRFNLMKEFYRVLKKNGRIAFQMGYGKNSPNTVNYYDDNYTALATNRGCDARVDSSTQIKKDLEKIGFKNFEYTIRPTGPGDFHPKWIFIRAQK